MAKVKITKRKNPNIQVELVKKGSTNSKTNQKTQPETKLPSRKTITKKSRQRQPIGNDQHNYSDDGTTMYRYSSRQTQSWKPLSKSMNTCLVSVLNRNQSLVLCKKSFQGDEAVSERLQDLTSSLTAKLQRLRVPQKKYGDYTKVKDTLAQLKEELSDLNEQELQLEKAMKKEQRNIDHISSMADLEQDIGVQLVLEVPEINLDIPPIEFH